MSDKNLFTREYYMEGIAHGLSNYENYEFRPDLTVAMVMHLRRYLGIGSGDFVLEIGCARGFYCKAMRMIGIRAFGQDISEWAIENCHPDVKEYVSVHLKAQPRSFDIVWGKDFGEHVPQDQLLTLFTKLCDIARRKVFIIVPLAKTTGGEYVHPKEENDKTHCIRWTLPDWLLFFQESFPDFVTSGSYRYPGLKPGSFEYQNGYGFVTLDRIT